MQNIPADLEKIAPLWYQRLVNEDPPSLIRIKSVNGKLMDLQNPRCCVVGEAYGFDDGYILDDQKTKCADCMEIGYDFHEYVYNKKSVPQVAKRLVDHWREEHSKSG